MAPATFELNVLDGSIAPSAALVGQALTDAQWTVQRLKLDDNEMRSARLDIIDQYLAGTFNAAFLRRESPFIWSELKRLGMH